MLRQIADAAHVALVLPPVSGKPVLNPPASRQQRQSLWRLVTAYPEILPRGSVRWRVMVRLAAVVALVLDTGARTGELVRLTTGSLAPDLSTVTIVRRAQGGGSVTETVPLSPSTQLALRRWLEIRDEVVGALTGDVKALLVTVHGGGPQPADHHGPRPPGLPLSDDSLRGWYAATVAKLNEETAGQYGWWEPMPRTLEALRRGVGGKTDAAGTALTGSGTEANTATAA
ncbi:hypothetical protein ACFW17_21875 [Streptomyces sp. NPDC058961]|uniref:hypothetical protein n=1 Tax=Streptomyces sp. NPDC058961 TaxID=3346680 RepID=UPI0036852E19